MGRTKTEDDIVSRITISLTAAEAEKLKILRTLLKSPIKNNIKKLVREYINQYYEDNKGRLKEIYNQRFKDL